MNYIQETFLSSISLEWVASYGTKARLEFAVAPTQGNAAARRMFDGGMRAHSRLFIITRNHLGNVDW